MTRFVGLLSILLLCALPLAGQMSHHGTSDHEPPADLGVIEFPNSGAAAAQPHFIRGVLLLHSFEYAPSARAFREAQAADPEFALAYWGEAMTFNHPIWGEQDLAAGRAVLARLAPTAAERAAKARTEREKGYMAAVEILFGEGEKSARDAAYSAAIGALAERFPGDLNARSFHALSLLGLAGIERDTRNYMRAASIAEEIYEIDKRHPGALHYLIHAYDDPVHAPLGLRAARLYAKAAPAASHAQHMPSHIFFALGMWEEAIASNIASMNTARDQGMGGYHPLHWLEHAYLQVGRRDDAAKLVAVMAGDVEKKPTGAARAHLAMTRATWLVETRGGGARSMREPVDSSGIVTIGSFAGHDLARGLAAIESEDSGAAAGALRDLRNRVAAGRKAVGSGTEVASRYDSVTPSELRAAEIMEMMLDGAIRFAGGKQDEGIRLAREAAAAEDSMSFEYGPPQTVKPPYELLGELLLRAGRRDEAAKAFERVLATHPNRTLTLEGLRKVKGEG
ncbi:MAG TPA: hypothetical protein VMT00_09500 [Thermoanaerobaculia bacterium]|nr:hypothetical protein [Thermoanaerobaculia bacterium]